MSQFDIALFLDLTEESRRGLERELERKRQIREAISARRVEPSRLASLVARMRHALRRDAHRPLVEGC